ncbi:PKD domain-containing protein [Desulfocicer vacuolatum]|uniref:PKD domain-containing protein n=1 Tax=Desulfocicer vacuolatum TaxID=2298 RepID=UPI001BAE7877|nr:PKD domain-containing protein [Desulfocicer vacuolatum]
MKISSSAFKTTSLNLNSQNNFGGQKIVTGLSSIDLKLSQLNVKRFKPLFSGLKNALLSNALGANRWFTIELENDADIKALVEEFKRDQSVENATPDWIAYPAVATSDPFYVDQWGHNNTGQLLDYKWGAGGHPFGNPVGTPGFDGNIEAAWGFLKQNYNINYGNDKVVIGIIDTGVDLEHPDLRLVDGYDFGDNDTNPDDVLGHGTACAGVAGAIADNGKGVAGVAGGCSIMPLKVADSDGAMYFSKIQQALYYAADHGVDVVSMSLGADISTDAATETALEYAYNKGVTLLAATGNDNLSSISYPASSPFVIAVGAANPCDGRKRSSSLASELNPDVAPDPNGYTCDGERWWGSNYGSSAPDSKDAVDIIAPTILPATDIMGSGGYDNSDYSKWFNGTSCATPFAAGVAALVKSLHPHWTPAQVRDQLIDTARDVENIESDAGWDRYSGYGLVDAGTAVEMAAVCDQHELVLTIILDQYPSETTWELKDDTGAVVYSGGPYITANSTDTETFCLSEGNYIFTIYDSYGDGLSGSYELMEGDLIHASGGSFSTFESTSFILGSTPNIPPKSDAGGVYSAMAGEAIQFNGNGSSDSDGTIEYYIWDFGDGENAVGIAPTHTYADAGTYTVTLTVEDDDGATDSSTAQVSITALGEYTILTYDDFEDGWGNYTSGGGDCLRYTGGTYAHQGRAAVDIQDNSGVASSFFYATGVDVLTPGYTTIRVEFWFRAQSMDNSNEDFQVQYFDGNTWHTVASYAKGVNFENGQFYNKTIVISESDYTFPTNMKLRFMCDASGNADDVYIDEIKVSAASLGGHNTPPQSDPGDSYTGIAGEAVQFNGGGSTDSDGTIVNYTWEFGDGGTAVGIAPIHTYAQAGVYTVTLTVEDDDGGTDSATAGVSISEPFLNLSPQSNAGGPYNGMAGEAVQFNGDASTDSDGIIVSYSWGFGDGGTAVGTSPIHTYTQAGTYAVTLTVEDDGGAIDTDTAQVTITAVGEYTILTYDDFEDGWGNYTPGGGDCLRYTDVTYAHQGNAAADIQDNSGIASSFFYTTGVDVSTPGYTTIKVEFWFRAQSMDNSNENFLVQYFDGNAWYTVASYAQGVDFENGQFYNKTIVISESDYAFPTNMKLRFLCDASGNADDIYIDEIRVSAGSSGYNSPPRSDAGGAYSGIEGEMVQFNGDGSTDSDGMIVSYAWDFGDGSAASGIAPVHTYGAAGSYTVTLTVEDDDGATDTSTAQVTISTEGEYTVLSYDDFENGWGSYTPGGGDCLLYTGGAYAHQGSAAADIQDNSGGASSFYHTHGMDVLTPGYTEIKVEFWFRAQSMDNSNEDFQVQYFDGSIWHTVASYAQGVDFENGQFYFETISIPNSTYVFPSDMKLRFMCDASGNRDDVYIDEITVVAK